MEKAQGSIHNTNKKDMKQTAVEWLDSQIDFLHKYMSECDRINLFKQAKEMEKQQIIDACNLQGSDYRGMPTYNKSGEQYYNETFKTK